MKLVLHHFWKDVRFSRWMLWLWLLIILIQTVLAVLAVQPNYQLANVAETIGPSGIWYFIDGALWTVLIVYLIQSEPTMGATSFWLTRPIPPLISILSKLIFILALVVVPSLVPRMMDFLLFGVPFNAINDATQSTVGVELTLALCVVWLATFTRNMIQFWGIVGILCILFVAYSITLAFRSSFMSSGGQAHPGLFASRMEVGFWIFTVGLIGSLVIQHWFRTTRKAFSLGLGSIALSIAALLWWPVVLPSISSALVHSASAKPVQLAYQLDPTKPFTWSTTQLLNTSYQNAKVSMISPPLSGEGIPFIRSIESSFQPHEGRGLKLRAPLDAYGYFTTDRLNWLPQLQQDNPGFTIEDGAPSAAEPMPAFMLNPELTGQLKDQTGTLNLKIKGDILSLQKRAEIPLKGTGFARIPAALVRLTAVQNDKDSINLSVEEVGYRDMLKWESLPTVYFLVDPKNRVGIILRKTIIKSEINNVSWGTLTRLSAVLNLQVKTADLPADIQASFKGDAANGLVLDVYEATSRGPFESGVKISDYTFHPGEQ